MKVREIMTAPPVTVRTDTTLEEAARLMRRHHADALPVIGADGSLHGVLTVAEFAAQPRPVPSSTLRLPKVFGRWLPPEGIEKLYDDARTLTAGEVMNRDVQTVTEDEAVEGVLKRMSDAEVQALTVVRGGVAVGVVSRRDLLRMMLPGDARPPGPRPHAGG